jgi:hypothetical protein
MTVLFILFSLGYFLIVRPGLKVYADLRELKAQTRMIKDGVILQDLPKIKRDLQGLDRLVGRTETDLRPFSWLQPIPFLGNYYKDAGHLLRAAHHGVAAGSVLIESVEPFADVLGFKTEQTAASLDAEKKLQGLVKVMPQIAPQMDDISVQFDLIRQEINQINPDRYPASFRGRPVRPLLSAVQDRLDRLEESFPDIRELLVVLPQVLGDPNEKTYLVLFQNDKELRPTGGFLTAYALITIREGRIVNVSSDDIYHLDLSIANHPASPAVLAQYLKVKEYYARDTNLSPDFARSAAEFEKFWARAPNVPPIDGIIGIDTYVVRDLLKVLGPVSLTGYQEEFNAENVVYQLELYANLLGRFQWDRKDLLGYLMNTLLDKAFHAPREQWSPLLATGSRLANEKHVLLYFHDSQAQKLAEKYNYAGRVKDFDEDYLHVNDANFAGAKANLYIKERVTQDYQIAADGTVKKTVTVELKNPEPNDGWLNGTYYDWMRIYVPKGSKLLDSSSWTSVTSSEELGKTVFTTYTYVYPQNSNSVSVTYELPFKVQKGQALKTLIQKQPGTDGHQYIIKVDGKEKDSFTLSTDREINVQL